MRMYMGEDHVEAEEDENSPGGIVVETLLSMRTVAALTIEKRRSEEYLAALKREDPAALKTNIKKGATTGLGFFIQCWGELNTFSRRENIAAVCQEFSS